MTFQLPLLFFIGTGVFTLPELRYYYLFFCPVLHNGILIKKNVTYSGISRFCRCWKITLVGILVDYTRPAREFHFFEIAIILR